MVTQLLLRHPRDEALLRKVRGDLKRSFVAKVTKQELRDQLEGVAVDTLAISEPERRWPPGDLAIWIFILAELSVFAIFFAAYAFARAADPVLFDTYQRTLSQDTAYINTLALITSSWLVVRAVAAIKSGDSRACARWLWAAVGMGGVFIGIKLGEYAGHFAQGITLSTNSFYMFYLSLTFFHFMHVLMGMVILAAVALRAGAGAYAADSHTGVETGASYWHMVDLVWLILFPLVYVMR